VFLYSLEDDEKNYETGEVVALPRAQQHDGCIGVKLCNGECVAVMKDKVLPLHDDWVIVKKCKQMKLRRIEDNPPGYEVAIAVHNGKVAQLALHEGFRDMGIPPEIVVHAADAARQGDLFAIFQCEDKKTVMVYCDGYTQMIGSKRWTPAF
jgi:hypothetical protein